VIGALLVLTLPRRQAPVVAPEPATQLS